jgi:HEAT repeat protein
MADNENEVSDAELKSVIADFLAQGHVDNIISMFRREPVYIPWTGDILQDERFSVRLGLSVLYEELKSQVPQHQLELAIPGLVALLNSPEPTLRGEAASLLGIIGGKKAISSIRSLAGDPDPQVKEIVAMLLEEEN